MSFSPYDMIMRLGDSDSLNTSGEQVSLDDDVIVSSSLYDTASEFDTMSLNSDTLQDFGSIVSLPPGTLAGIFRSHMEAEDGEQTIVSSAASGAAIPPPEASQDIWAISPHPHIMLGSAQSITTVCTDSLSYSRLLENASNENDDDDDDNSSLVSNSQAMVPLSSQSSTAPDGHDPVTFVAVASNLMRDSTDNVKWFNRFTEYDWEQFQDVAKMILTIIDPTPKPLPLPPSPPVSIDSMVTNATYDAKDFVPEDCICALCEDVVVGALALDCECSSSTVCMSCWENHNSMFSNQLGFVWVEQRSCPSCFHPAASSVPCNSLDVAILEIVRNLDQRDVRALSLMQSYYSRLEAWRLTVEEMNISDHQSTITRRDEMLAQLIHEEESLLWKKQQVQAKAKANVATDLRLKPFFFLGQTAIALIAATLASAGLGALAQRRKNSQ